MEDFEVTEVGALKQLEEQLKKAQDELEQLKTELEAAHRTLAMLRLS